MQPKPDRRPPRQADGDARLLYLFEFEKHLRQAGFADFTIRGHRGTARHFLVWLEEDGTPLGAIDDAVIRRFRDHKCRCAPPAGIGPRYKTNIKTGHLRAARRSGAGRFVQFLELTGRTAHPGDGELRRYLLTAFLDECAAQGHPPGMLRCYRAVVSHFLAWLHHSRTPIRAVRANVVDRFFEHDCVCLGNFSGLSKVSATTDYGHSIRKFTSFLVARGFISDDFGRSRKSSCPQLGPFHHWLRRHRGIGERTIREHDRAVRSFLADLGVDPSAYSAASIRETLMHRTRNASGSSARNMAISMRMYLRFLASTGECPASLVDAVPTFARWRLSSLPRYIAADEIERVIASCDPDTAIGIRDRAILLLLARLGLRAGDVVHLLLGDIDWNRSRLHVRGKSRQSAMLPLPQDAGDALLEYIETARPRVNEKRVFMRVRAPHRPFAGSSSISFIVSRALKRAGVCSPGGRGAHLLRHSAATSLLRSGATLDVIGAVLRHRSPNTTAIYAKVDVAMLQEVAQPWIGGTS